MLTKQNTEFDVAVVGAGPAGLMAAARAAELGGRVVVLEKNKRPGRKLLLTGKGRCNITNAEFNLRTLVGQYGDKGKFLFHAFAKFGPQAVIDFFAKLGLPTKVERGQRVFPVSDRANDVLQILLKFLRAKKVLIMNDAAVQRVECRDQKITRLILKNGEIAARNYIFCTGGKSYPATGSTGEGFIWVKKMGHQITELAPALVPISVREKWLSQLVGLSLKNVQISVTQNNKIQAKEFGECLFAHFGLSGPIILDISQTVGRLLKEGAVKLVLDLKPALDLAALDQRLQRDFKKYQNKEFKNSLAELLPRKLIPVIVELSGIDPDKQVNVISKTERRRLCQLLKNLEMTATGLLGFDQAIVTSGGVALHEIDDKTMRSKIVDNLFFAGEMLDVDGPTGGFNLQVCWSTGRLAGEAAFQKE